jgi:hypothetical protein
MDPELLNSERNPAFMQSGDPRTAAHIFSDYDAFLPNYSVKVWNDRNEVLEVVDAHERALADVIYSLI